jgi:hypothetical protein
VVTVVEVLVVLISGLLEDNVSEFYLTNRRISRRTSVTTGCLRTQIWNRYIKDGEVLTTKPRRWICRSEEATTFRNPKKCSRYPTERLLQLLRKQYSHEEQYSASTTVIYRRKSELATFVGRAMQACMPTYFSVLYFAVIFRTQSPVWVLHVSLSSQDGYTN